MEREKLVERFLAVQLVEACRCLEEGVATAKDIDLAMRAGAGLKQGPLARADEEGLDVMLTRLEALERAHGPRFAPPEVLRKLVAEGKLGRKSGRGFFEYSA